MANMKKIALFNFVFFFVFNISNAQIYDFSVRNETYTPLEKSTSVTNNEVWKNLEYSIPIGFDFPFYDKLIDSLHTQGGVTLMVDNINGHPSTRVFSAFIPILKKVVDLGFLEGESLSDISYLLEGVEGSRIFKIEWRNVGIDSEIFNGTGASFFNIQIWLHESDGSIEFRYGDSRFDNPVDSNPSSVTIGLIGNFNSGLETFDEFMLLHGDPTNPFLYYLGYYPNYYELSLDFYPPDGTVYTFSRSSVSTEDIRQLSSEFEIQPNPALDFVSLKTKNDINSIQSVSIYNSTGALVKIVESDYDLIKVSDLNPGMYHLNILTDQGLATKRFVKM